MFIQSLCYTEFNPKDFKNVLEVIERYRKIYKKEFSQNPLNEYSMLIERVPGNAELHFIKSTVWIKKVTK